MLVREADLLSDLGGLIVTPDDHAPNLSPECVLRGILSVMDITIKFCKA